MGECEMITICITWLDGIMNTFEVDSRKAALTLVRQLFEERLIQRATIV